MSSDLPKENDLLLDLPAPAALALVEGAICEIRAGLDGLEGLDVLDAPGPRQFAARIRSGLEALRKALEHPGCAPAPAPGGQAAVVKGSFAIPPPGASEGPNPALEAIPGFADLPVLNPEQIGELRGEELLESLSALFREMAGGVMDAMDAAARAGDAKELSAKAHLLKGSAINFGADRLVAVCQELERSAGGLEPWRRQKLLDAVRAEYQLVNEALNAL